jgi:hypothetical protein
MSFQMKPSIAIAAAVATMTFNGVAKADVVYHPFMINPAYQVPVGPLTPHQPRHVVRSQPLGAPPVACEAVIFPRSPVCAGRPARFSPYAHFPWNAYVYY